MLFAARSQLLISSVNSSLPGSVQREVVREMHFECMNVVSNQQRLNRIDRDGVTVLDFGNVEIWDGGDLTLLRESFVELIDVQNCRSVGVEMSHVKYVPSGFFGLMFDLVQLGVEVRLFSPKPHVMRMVWFQQFFECDGDERYLLAQRPKRMMVVPSETNWLIEEQTADVVAE